MHPEVGVGMIDGTFRNIEKVLDRHIEKREVSQLDVVLEKGISNSVAVLPRDENGATLKPSEAIESELAFALWVAPGLGAIEVVVSEHSSP